MSLARLEATFWECIRADCPPARSNEFVDRAPLDASRRLGIYHHAYFERQYAVLAELYPKLRAVLGDASFGRIAGEYVKRRPSRTPIIERIGEEFPDFLRNYAAFEPAIVDLSRLEWARVEAILAGDPRGAVSLAELARVDATAIRLVPAPSTRLLQVAPGTAELWRDSAAKPETGAPEFVLVVRVDHTVRHLTLSPCAGRALERTLEGASLAAAFSEFSGADEIALAREALATFVELRVWSHCEAYDDQG